MMLFVSTNLHFLTFILLYISSLLEWHECTKFRYITCVTPTGYRRENTKKILADEFGNPHKDHREVGDVKNHGGAGNHHQNKCLDMNKRQRKKCEKQLGLDNEGGV